MGQSKKGRTPDYQINKFLEKFAVSKDISFSQARKYLTHRYNESDVYRVLEKNIQSNAVRKLILLAMSLNRKQFFPLFLLNYGNKPNILDEIGFMRSLEHNPLDDTEQKQLVQYIISNWQYDIRFLSYLDQNYLQTVLDEIMLIIETDGLQPKHLKAFSYSENHLARIQDRIRAGIDSVPVYRKNGCNT